MHRSVHFVSLLLLGNLLEGVASAQLRWEREQTPPAQYHQGMVYDIARDRLVAVVNHRDTLEVWEGKPAVTPWVLRQPVASPNGRGEFAVTYDENRQRVVLFGGDRGGPIDELWEWDGNQWEERTTPGPAPRRFHDMTYHKGLGVVVLFGGEAAGGTLLDDMWAWDGNGWAQLAGGPMVPAARSLTAITYDSSYDELFLYGGYIGNNVFTDDCWRWSPAGWQALPVLSTPGARGWHDMAYDASRSRVVMCGQYLLWNNQKTWEWNRASLSWVEASATAPSSVGREGPHLAYDSASKEVMLFGGQGNYGIGWSSQYGQRADLHRFDSAASQWQVVVPSRPGSAGRTMAYDSVRGVTVLHGQPTGSSPTWERTLFGWTPVVHAPGTFPVDGGEGRLADTGLGRVLLFGGYETGAPSNQTWTFDGTAWQQIPSGLVPARIHHAVVGIDGIHHSDRVFLFGGRTDFGGTALDDTWVWQTGGWTQTVSAVKPPPLYHHAVAYDPVRDRVVLFGGLERERRPQPPDLGVGPRVAPVVGHAPREQSAAYLSAFDGVRSASRRRGAPARRRKHLDVGRRRLDRSCVMFDRPCHALDDHDLR